MIGQWVDLRRSKTWGYLYALTLISAGMSGTGRAVEVCDDTSLSQASPKDIQSCLKQEAKREALGGPALPYASPKTATEERIQALRAVMGAPPQKKAYPAGIYVYTTAELELKEGAPRGNITYPLYQGTASDGRKVYFVLSEASDREFAEEFGVIHAIRLQDVNQDGIEECKELSQGGLWVFAQDPGRVSHIDAEGNVKPVDPNPNYSPLQCLKWEGRDKVIREVIANVPMVKWGDGPGQQLPIDRSQDPLHRYGGGQALAIRILDNGCQTAKPWKPCGWVTMKLHQTVHREDLYPYLTVFSASEADIAEKLGVPHTPKLAWAGRSNASPPLGLSGEPGGSEGVSSIVEFHNGVKTWVGGPEGFQPGVISYGEPTWSTYSPIVHVTWAFFDCGGGGQHMTYWNVACPKVAARLAGKRQGTVYEGRLSELWSSGDLVITESAKLYGSKMHLVLDAPAPVAVIRR